MFKRFIAFTIDMVVVFILLGILSSLLPDSNRVKELNKELNTYNEQMLKHEITFKEYVKSYADVGYEIDKVNDIENGLNILVFIIYFIIIPLMYNGYTLGLKIMDLKLGGKLSVKNLFLRNTITVGLLYMILSVFVIHLTNYKYYFILMSILSFIQFLLVIISIFMIIYRGDKKGLQDIISNTIVEEVK